MSSIISINDLSDANIEKIFMRADELRKGKQVRCGAPGHIVGLIFLEPSLRTRVGFSAAAARLGWQTVEVTVWRHGAKLWNESWSDTLRTVAGYTDVIVSRPGCALELKDTLVAEPCALINGGDVGPKAEHPSQALIDVFSLEQLVGPMGEVGLAIIGDPRMRAVRSLLAVLARRPPDRLQLVVDPEHLREMTLPEVLEGRTELRTWEELEDVDAVYLAGIPHGSLPQKRRELLFATPERVNRLSPTCILLSPGPVIDEMHKDVQGCARDRRFEQSDMGLFVRMAILEHVAADRCSQRRLPLLKEDVTENEPSH